MVVRIRLARFGKRNNPFYNIVVANQRTARNSKPIEVIGTYDPIPKLPSYGGGGPFKNIQLDQARAKYWLGVGAQPSEPMQRLLSMIGLTRPSFKVAQAMAARNIMGSDLVKDGAVVKAASQEDAKTEEKPAE